MIRTFVIHLFIIMLPIMMSYLSGRQFFRSKHIAVRFFSQNQILVYDGNQELDVPAKVNIKNTQLKFHVDKLKVEDTTKKIMRALNLEKYSVDIWFCSDKTMKQINHQWRYKNETTDVLSFPNFDFTEPEVFDDEMIKFVMNIGDIIISMSCVERQMRHDMKNFQDGRLPSEAMEDRGVSKVMSTVFSVEDRVPYLLIHSILHLIGYDHETDEDYLKMTEREEDVMKMIGLVP